MWFHFQFHPSARVERQLLPVSNLHFNEALQMKKRKPVNLLTHHHSVHSHCGFQTEPGRQAKGGCQIPSMSRSN